MPPCQSPNAPVEFTDEEGTVGRDKLVFAGKDCTLLHVDSSLLTRCGVDRPFNVVNIGASVARGHFVHLCELLNMKAIFSNGAKHQAMSCQGGNIHIWHMFLPGVYTKPSQTKRQYESLRRSLAKNVKVHRIWDKRVPFPETALPKLTKMIERKVSPWPDFDIQDADLLFWSSGVWDVAFKQDLSDYKEKLLHVSNLFRNKLPHTYVVFRTIPRFAPRMGPKIFYGWDEVVRLVPMYNIVTRQVQEELGFDLIDVYDIPRADEIYDGIHFAKQNVKLGLTGNAIGPSQTCLRTRYCRSFTTREGVYHFRDFAFTLLLLYIKFV